MAKFDFKEIKKHLAQIKKDIDSFLTNLIVFTEYNDEEEEKKSKNEIIDLEKQTMVTAPASHERAEWVTKISSQGVNNYETYMLNKYTKIKTEKKLELQKLNDLKNEWEEIYKKLKELNIHDPSLKLIFNSTAVDQEEKEKKKMGSSIGINKHEYLIEQERNVVWSILQQIGDINQDLAFLEKVYKEETSTNEPEAAPASTNKPVSEGGKKKKTKKNKKSKKKKTAKKKQRKGGRIDYALGDNKVNTNNTNNTDSKNSLDNIQAFLKKSREQFPTQNDPEEMKKMKEKMEEDNKDPARANTLVDKTRYDGYVEKHNKKNPENPTTLEIALKQKEDVDKRTKELLDKIEKEKQEKQAEEEEGASEGGKKKRKKNRKSKKSRR